jgi:hypothetical protein
MATLGEVIAGLSAADDDLTIYAEEPWTPRSRAVVAEEPDDGSLPGEAQGLRYFLEVFLGREVAEAYPTAAVEAVMYYAVNDAYPPGLTPG